MPHVMTVDANSKYVLKAKMRHAMPPRHTPKLPAMIVLVTLQSAQRTLFFGLGLGDALSTTSFPVGELASCCRAI
jgi:hypothetical protein